MEQKRFIKFLGVILDEYILFKDCIRTVENKIAKIQDDYTEPNNYPIQVLLKVFIFHIFIHILTMQILK